jgi:hypothetical protein
MGLVHLAHFPVESGRAAFTRVFFMTNLLQLANGNHVAPYLIKGIRRIPKKGLVITNEFNKLMDFGEETDDLVIAAYAAAIKDVIDAGKRFVQPDWKAIREAVLLQNRTSSSIGVDAKKVSTSL